MRRLLASTAVLLPFACWAALTCGGTMDSANDATPGDAGHSSDAVAKDVVPPHRAVATACDASRPPGDPHPGLDSGCVTDTDCDAGLEGRCIGTYFCSLATGCEENVCSYDTCLSDDACHGKACTCREAFPLAFNMGDTCDAIGACRIDSDCPGGQLCSPSYVSGCAAPAYFCHTQVDECIADVDCKANGGTCAFSTAKGHWTCQWPCTDG